MLPRDNRLPSFFFCLQHCSSIPRGYLAVSRQTSYLLPLYQRKQAGKWKSNTWPLKDIWSINNKGCLHLDSAVQNDGICWCCFCHGRDGLEANLVPLPTHCECVRVFVYVCLCVCLPLGRLCKARFSAFISWLIYVVTFAFALTITLLERRQRQDCTLSVCMCVYVRVCLCESTCSDVQK